MIRFRIGHRWKREPAGAPHDSVSLELDGVNLLPGAVEEPLVEGVSALLTALLLRPTSRFQVRECSHCGVTEPAPDPG